MQAFPSDRASVASLTAMTFSDWFLTGPDEKGPVAVKAMAEYLSRTPDTDVAAAAKGLGQTLENADLGTLRSEWTAAFALGTGSVTPHESVIRTGLVMQEPRDATLAWMRSRGLMPSTVINEAHDHIGMQLAFFATLCLQPQVESDGKAAPAAVPQEALLFAQERLAWLPGLQAALADAGTARSVQAAVALLAAFVAALPAPDTAAAP